MIPAENFTTGFSKLGYKGIKDIFDTVGVNYARPMITNAETLKFDLLDLPIKQYWCTLCSIDIENMYPLIIFDLIKQALTYFALPLMVEFGMRNMFLMFGGQYYQYEGATRDRKKGLTIGGFESAWLAYLVAA